MLLLIPYSMTKIRKANWSRTRAQAYAVLKKHNVQDFPINILEIISTYKDIKVLTYEQFSLIQDLSVEEVIKINSSADGSIHYHADKKKYVIIYNDKVRSAERIYWTLAHEFGHYILNHHKETKRSRLSRNDMSEEEYDLYEFEADFFARYLINPPSIIKEWNTVDVHRVVSFFKISYKAALNSLSYLQRIAKNGWTVVAPDDIKLQLSGFIHSVNHGKTCTECNSFFALIGSSHCLICGSNKLTNIKRGDDYNMIYTGIKVDNKSRAIVCPVCKNEELNFDGDHCTICNSVLTNRCADVLGFSEYNYGQEEHIISHSCGTLLPGNARYCFKCGNHSIYNENNYLTVWNQDEIDRQLREQEDDDDDDVPF